MAYLIVVSIIWGFSFGLIKGQLTGLPAELVAFIRLLISFLFFLPFFRYEKRLTPFVPKFLLLGAVQFGGMYIAYISAYRYLMAYQVALFTLLTPIYIVLIDNLGKAQFNKRAALGAFTAVAASLVIVFREMPFSDFLTGFILLQISNLCFAWGQLYYGKLKNKIPEFSDSRYFALIYLGAVLITFSAALFTRSLQFSAINNRQWLTLLYLGLLPSGLGFFWWNFGAARVPAALLAVMNNLKIPLAVLISILIFDETASLLRLAAGSALFGLAIYLARFPKFPAVPAE
ncbi:MAG: carboxylate/amino acid/amine transporter [Calditrichia bacterium]